MPGGAWTRLAAAALVLAALCLAGQAWQASVRDARSEGVAFGMVQARDSAYARGYADGSEEASWAGR